MANRISFSDYESGTDSCTGIEFDGVGRWSLADGQGDLSARQSQANGLNAATDLAHLVASDRAGATTKNTVKPLNKFALFRNILETLGGSLGTYTVSSSGGVSITIGAQAYRLGEAEAAIGKILRASRQDNAIASIGQFRAL